GFVGVDVHLEGVGGGNPDHDVAVGQIAPFRVDGHLDDVAVRDAEVLRIFGAHVDVSPRADDPSGERERAFGPDEGTAGAAFGAARGAYRRVEAEVKLVGPRDLDLVLRANRAEDSHAL